MPGPLEKESGTKRGRIAAHLRRHIVSGLHLGILRPGDRLPSTRSLSRSLGADPRVVQAAYRDLADLGLVERRSRSGVYIASGRGHPAARLPQLAEWAVGVLAEGLEHGVPAPELPEHLRRCLETLRLRAVCLECNDDQLHSVCEETRGDYGLETHGALLSELDREETRVALRQADLLVTTSFHGDEVAALAAQYALPWISISLREDIITEVKRRLTQEVVYFVGTDPRLDDKLREIFTPLGAAENVRTLIVGRDDLSQIPPAAPTTIFRRARPLITDEGLLARVAPVERVFSHESAREILSHIVQANLTAMQARRVAHRETD